ncbi:hypothetical protein [Amycolatopsis vancoresmycina]|uniref:hypothetical protein n=1 Tax=Amycolatopsis vancoresmycina TaxID=208444 RepID=UPI0005242241|nr:hypothetical protein [Amycolatopsis vancoresmycina]
MSKFSLKTMTIGSAAAMALALAPAAAVAAPVSDNNAGSVATWPTGCDDYQVGNGWEARCTGGTGKYQAIVYCVPYGGGQTVIRSSAWNHAPNLARVYCPSLTYATSGGINTTPDP